MSRRDALAMILVGAAFAGGAGAAGASGPAHFAKVRDCRLKSGGNSQRAITLSKFTKLKAYSLGCKTTRTVANALFNRARTGKACNPGFAEGKTSTCTVRHFRCRTTSHTMPGPNFTGTCVRGARKIAFMYVI